MSTAQQKEMSYAQQKENRIVLWASPTEEKRN
jgi:hypothetical protein